MNTHISLSLKNNSNERSMTAHAINGVCVDIPELGTTDDAHVMEIIMRGISCGVLSRVVGACDDEDNIVTITYCVNAVSMTRRYCVVDLAAQQPDGSFDDEVLARGTYWIDNKGGDPVVWDLPRKAATLPQVIRVDASLMLWWMWQYQHEEMTTGGGIYEFRWDDAIEVPM